jgi:hypothetical protein
VERLLDEPPAVVLPQLADRPADRELVVRLAAGALRHLTASTGTLARGVCHGDASLHNLVVAEGGLALIDFDLAALPWFGVAETVANLRFHLVDKTRLRGTESRSEGWVDASSTICTPPPASCCDLANAPVFPVGRPAGTAPWRRDLPFVGSGQVRPHEERTMMQPTASTAGETGDGLLGRRTVLRLAGLAVTVAAVSACGGAPPAERADRAAPTDEGTDGGAPMDEGATDDDGATDGGGDVLEDLVKGSWKLTAAGTSCVLTVEDGTWKLTEGKGPGNRGPLTRTLHGTWTVTAGVLQVGVFDDDEDTTAKQGVGQPLPKQVGPSDALSVQWAYDREPAQPVPIRRDGDQAVITYPNHDGALVITARRA